MWTSRVRLLEDVSPADWLGNSLTGPPGTVHGTVPAGYEAYARVLHPVEMHDGENDPVTWAHVGAVTGRRVHPTVQWHRLIGDDDPFTHGTALWPAGRPEQGNLVLPALRTLCDVLTEHTGTPGDCYFALWVGWGQLSGGRTVLTLDGHRAPSPPLLDPRERAGPTVRLPGREYHLLRGPLEAMTELVRYDGPGVWWTQSPSLFWPAGRPGVVRRHRDRPRLDPGGREPGGGRRAARHARARGAPGRRRRLAQPRRRHREHLTRRVPRVTPRA